MTQLLLLPILLFQLLRAFAQEPPRPELKSLALPEKEALLDFDVDHHGTKAVLLTQSRFGRQTVRIWEISPDAPPIELTHWEIPDSIATTSIVWHPVRKFLFLMGSEGGKFKIYQSSLDAWAPRALYESDHALRRLVMSPHPMRDHEYRLFFGVKNPDAHYSIHSITEKGQHEGLVIDSKPPTGAVAKKTKSPTLIAVSALPVALDPNGKFLIWENEDHCFQKAFYDHGQWKKSVSVLDSKPICRGSLSLSANGSDYLHWVSAHRGVLLITHQGKKTEQLASTLLFESTPAFLDHGIFGAVRENENLKLIYFPTPI